jgi:hypothetical protein
MDDHLGGGIGSEQASRDHHRSRRRGRTAPSRVVGAWRQAEAGEEEREKRGPREARGGEETCRQAGEEDARFAEKKTCPILSRYLYLSP